MSKNYSFVGAVEGIVVFWLCVLGLYPYTKKVEYTLTAVLAMLIVGAAVLIGGTFPQAGASASVDTVTVPSRDGVIVSESADSALSMRFYVGNQGMDEGVDRSDACRTFHVFGHQVEQTGETDAMACGLANAIITATVGVTPTPTITTTEVTTSTPTVEPTQPPTSTPTVVVTPTISTTTTVVVTEVPPTVIPTQPPTTETPRPTEIAGNPGNDKPVGQTEHCELGMCENEGGQDGEHGNSGNDDGHGNHDH